MEDVVYLDNLENLVKKACLDDLADLDLEVKRELPERRELLVLLDYQAWKVALVSQVRLVKMENLLKVLLDDLV